jgi:hypothetical protein
MRPLVLATGLLLAGVSHAQAAPCVAGTLASYLALGGAGCTIGTATLADFRILVETDVLGGAVTVTPVQLGDQVGLTFGSIGTATDMEYRELLVGYTVAASAITAAFVTLTGDSDDDGFGVATGLTDLCFGGTFGTQDPSTCSTSNVDTLVTALILGDVMDQDMRIFLGPFGLLGVLSTLTADGGGVFGPGSSTVSSYTNRFRIAQAVPEPATWLLCALGAIALARRRRA